MRPCTITDHQHRDLTAMLLHLLRKEAAKQAK
jgi:hypothetical protein